MTSQNALSITSPLANGLIHSSGYTPANSQRSASQPMAKEPIKVMGIPQVSISRNEYVHGDSQSSSERSYTPLKVVGDGSFGTVLLVDWHSLLPPNTLLSPMQRGGGARQEWMGKRLVALKRMKRKWEGGWDECKNLKELESLRAIPFHPNIIPLYDFFLLHSTKELYFVFEPMEGNLYQLIKSRKGRPLAGGLVSSIFRQVVSGLHHIHFCGYFHRDMKPENLLVTTTGLFDYRTVSPIASPTAPPEKDVVVIVKLADFGLAREIKSKPPYTEYVSTRWYRAPEVLLRSRDYSSPVDMWALGTIMAELISLKPLFPGHTEANQVARICEVLGDPSDEYTVDSRGSSIGGGKWVKGIKMARAVGFVFPKIQPIPISTLFDRNIPTSLINCISDLLKYDPDIRLTSRQCLEHSYLTETTSGNTPPAPQYNNFGTVKPTPTKIANRLVNSSASSVLSLSPHPVHPIKTGNVCRNGSSSTGILSVEQSTMQRDHDFVPQSISSDTGRLPNPDHLTKNEPCLEMRSSGSTRPALAVFDSSFIDPSLQKEAQEDLMDVSRDILDQSLEGVSNWKNLMPDNNFRRNSIRALPRVASQNHRHWIHFPKAHFWSARGHANGNANKSQESALTTADEMATDDSNKASPPKRIPYPSSNNVPFADLSSVDREEIHKNMKKEAKRIAQDAEIQRRMLAERRSREQSRAVIQKMNQLATRGLGELSYAWDPIFTTDERVKDLSSTSSLNMSKSKIKSKIKSRHGVPVITSSSSTVNAAGGKFRGSSEAASVLENDLWKDIDHRSKARRRDLDDDHSMSSSDIQSVGRVSMMSFATVDSDPGPSRRHQSSFFGINRIQSTSSLRTSFGDDFPVSARSSNSLSFEQQLVHDFDSQASFSSYDAARSSFSESSSPPPMQILSLSSQQQPSTQSLTHQKYITLPLPISSMHLQPGGQTSPYEYGQNGHIQAHPSSPSIAPYSVINPMFKVPPIPSPTTDSLNSSLPHTLPPFSHLASVAEHYPPLSPMSFHTPEDS